MKLLRWREREGVQKREKGWKLSFKEFQCLNVEQKGRVWYLRFRKSGLEKEEEDEKNGMLWKVI